MALTIKVTLPHESNIWRSFNDLEVVKLKVNPSNQDTPLIRTLSSSPMTVQIRGVSLYFKLDFWQMTNDDKRLVLTCYITFYALFDKVVKKAQVLKIF